MTTTMIPITSEPLKINILPEVEGKYTASCDDITHLVDRPTFTPFLNAARALLERGYDPRQRIVMVRYYTNPPSYSLTSTIGYAAGLMVTETRSDPKFIKYKPFKKK